MPTAILGRRRALKYVGMLAGTTNGQRFLASWLPSVTGISDCHHELAMSTRDGREANESSPTPQFFKPEEFQTVQILTEMIIPTDEQPGAREAKVADFLDGVVFAASEFDPLLQDKWVKGLKLLDELSTQSFGRPFRQASEEHRLQLLTEMSLPERDPGAQHPGFSFFSLAKEMTVEGFYSSRIGLLDVLEFKGLTFVADFPGCTHAEHKA